MNRPALRLVGPSTPIQAMVAKRQAFLAAWDAVLVAQDMPPEYEDEEIVSTTNAMHQLMELRRHDRG